MYSEGCGHVDIAWVLGSEVLPYSNSSRSMALDNLFLQTLFSVQQKKKGGGGHCPKVQNKTYD